MTAIFSSLRRCLQHCKSVVYDLVAVRMTTVWYREVLVRLPMGTTLLDVGIGTASSLLANRDVVLSKGMKVVGVDYEKDYVDFAREAVRKSTLNSSVSLVHADIHKYNTEYTQTFNAVYFSGSFMIIPRKVEALKHVVRMLKPQKSHDDTVAVSEPLLYFTQTFEKNNWYGRRVVPFVKWLLKCITTVDFGEVTFESDFRKVLREAAVDILEVVPIKKKRNRVFVLVIAKPMTPKCE